MLSLGSGLGNLLAGGQDLLDPSQVRNFGDYELIEEIARGGMGVVYRARQMSLGREVAVKMILAGELATLESVQRFRNEATAAAQLHHPNIISVFEIGEHETQHYFSMRLVPGRRNIATWAKSLGSAPAVRFAQVAGMMAKVAHAVAFAHDRGVLHRDLKPANVLVDEEDEPQVTDFGLAKLMDDDSGLTMSAAMLGSPSYMAPEQADGRHGDITTATDVYGLGAVLYELLAGRPPFMGKSSLITARMVVEQMPERLRDVPRDLETLCLKCLAKEPAQRYASALALAEDLERFARGEPVQARALTAPEMVWRWSRRRPKIAALLGALALAFVLGFSGVIWQWRRAETARVEQQRALQHLEWNEIVRQAGTEEKSIALAKLAAILRKDPAKWQAAMLAMSIVDQKACPVLAGPPVLPNIKLITDPRLAPNGSWFAAAGADQSVRVWDAATGRERARMPLKSTATALAVAQGPWVLAVGTADGAVSSSKTPGGPFQSLPRAGRQIPEELLFSAEGSHLAVRSKDGIEVWACGAPERSYLFELEGGVRGVDIAADGRRVLGWNAQRAAVWDTGSNQLVMEMAALTSFRRGDLAAGGKRVAFVDGHYVARIWDLESRMLLSTLDSPLPQWRFAALNATGTRVTIGGTSNDLVIFDTTSGLQVSPPMQHLYYPSDVIASPDGKRIISLALDGRACAWDAETGRALQSAIWLDRQFPNGVDTSEDGKSILIFPRDAGVGDDKITVWRSTLPQVSERKKVADQRNFDGCRLSPDGRLGCLGLSPGNRTYLYELDSGRVVLDAAANGPVYIQLFSPDMRRHYVLTANGWMHGWSLETGAPLWPPVQRASRILPGAISQDGTRIIAGHSGGHIGVYDTASGTLVQILDHPGELKSLRFAPDRSGRFVSTSSDGFAHVWDLSSGQRLTTFTGHGGVILASAWSSDGRLVATASYDQTARVWDAATGRTVGQAMPHLAWLSHLEFSPNGNLLATACRDGTVRLWNPLTGEPASPPLPQGDTVDSVRFTQDGACLVSRDHSGFRFWDTENAEQVTMHYREPVSGGIGMDSESLRSYLAADGTRMFLGCSMQEGALWTIPQPRARVPGWFPDFLEGLALMRLEGGSVRVSSGVEILELKTQLIGADRHDAYAQWARRTLGGEGR